ncbi:hypothetical protein CS0771_40070 [Catellatospora sp. IY07-71]|uniref:non-ribosomal peptide synthetase n=1 Tax=Catellatospora sp. IY07-71 TaxID=2728827 RepID=UPI001BB3F49F|nr:non-ribosomal peptide synthetase [Catellatospora sp. IY07-71]BCJ74463.1 hypothetical protein CS0771_40070 [Catellatospora sp. IY07-71]
MTQGDVLPYPDRRFPDLVADRARAFPDAVAVRQWDTTLTYGALHAAAGALAARLRADAPQVLVGVCADRRPPLLTALLGVLRAGAGYVPLDPALPPARLREIAAEAGLRTVVCDELGERLLADSGLELVAVPDTAADPGECPATAEDLAYVMFTSGSTGRPKGVMIPHEALTEFVSSLTVIAGLDARSVMLGFASIGFDASVIDLLAPLAAGGTIALAGAADRADPVRLQRFCAEHAVTVAFLPPALLPVLDPAALPALRVVLTGSEAPGPEQAARWTDGGGRFLNLFGPTETTVLVTWFEAAGAWDRPLPIGRPAVNHRVYVVDEQLRQVAPGEAGELLAGGAGLARGYLGAPELTEQRFVPDPFSGLPGARLYRTGDLVRWGPDGELEFLGRVDRQVKIRGQRVELGEVEAVLRRHPEVGHAAVAVSAGPAGTQLVAFVTGGVTPESVRAHCAARLGAAMVPARVVPVPELPLLPSGKVDVDRLLADHAATGAEVPYQEPDGDVEREVAAAWAELLGLARVGRDDDLFDTGGHSITAMRLVAALRARLGRDVAVEDVLHGRTLRVIAERAGAAAPLGGEPPVRGRPPALSPSQQRLWFLERYSPEAAAAYNIVLAERLRGPLDTEALRAALTAVAARQEVLRWRFPDADGVPYAVLDPVAPVPLPVSDLSSLAAEQREQELAAALAAEAGRRFRLAADALWRVRLFRLGPDEHVLAITAHHAVFDGWSQSLLYADLAAAYAAPDTLPPLPATYADYVAWRDERRTRRADGDLDWWTSHLDGVPTVLEVPGDRPRPAEQTYAGGYAGCWLDEAATADLHRFARGLGATPSAVLLAAFGLVLAGRAGQDELVVGTPAVDRRHPDFEDMVGFFIDIMPLRLRAEPGRGFAEHVRAARDELIAALAHPEAPLERIVQAFGLGGQTVRSPLVQVLFNVFNFAAPRLDLAGLTAEPVPVPAPGSAFDLTLYGVERDGRMRLEVVYNSDLYDRSTMDGFLDALREVIVRGTADGELPAAELVPEPVRGARVETPRARVRPVKAEAVISRPPETATERAVAAVWCEVLGRDAVGVTDNFFDSGGGSLAMATVQQRLNRLLGRELRVVDLFRYPTVRALAAHLDGAGQGADGTDDAVELALRRGAARRARTRQRPGVAGEEL